MISNEGLNDATPQFEIRSVHRWKENTKCFQKIRPVTPQKAASSKCQGVPLSPGWHEVCDRVSWHLFLSPLSVIETGHCGSMIKSMREVWPRGCDAGEYRFLFVLQELVSPDCFTPHYLSKLSSCSSQSIERLVLCGCRAFTCSHTGGKSLEQLTSERLCKLRVCIGLCPSFPVTISARKIYWNKANWNKTTYSWRCYRLVPHGLAVHFSLRIYQTDS